MTSTMANTERRYLWFIQNFWLVNPQRIKRPMKSSDLYLLQINYYKFEIKILKVRIPFGVNWDDLGIDLRDLGIRFCCFDDFVALIAKPNIYLIVDFIGSDCALNVLWSDDSMVDLLCGCNHRQLQAGVGII